MKVRKTIVTENILKEIVRWIVAAVQPEKIILFGSAARDEMGPDSDLDLLIIKTCAHRRKTARKIERSLIWAAGDTIVLKRLRPLKPSRIANRVPENGPPLKDIAAEMHRMRRETRSRHG